jgi:hypothetical protein
MILSAGRFESVTCNVPSTTVKIAPYGGGGCRAQPLQIPQNRNLNNRFVHIMISNVLRDFPFGRNRQQKSADDWYIRILKNKSTNFKKQEDRTLWLSHGACSYIRMYINAFAGSFMLYLRRDFYNIIFKTKYKLYIASGSALPPQRKKSGCASDCCTDILLEFVCFLR